MFAPALQCFWPGRRFLPSRHGAPMGTLWHRQSVLWWVTSQGRFIGCLKEACSDTSCGRPALGSQRRKRIPCLLCTCLGDSKDGEVGFQVKLPIWNPHSKQRTHGWMGMVMANSCLSFDPFVCHRLFVTNLPLAASLLLIAMPFVTCNIAPSSMARSPERSVRSLLADPAPSSNA